MSSAMVDSHHRQKKKRKKFKIFILAEMPVLKSGIKVFKVIVYPSCIFISMPNYTHVLFGGGGGC